MEQQNMSESLNSLRAQTMANKARKAKNGNETMLTQCTHCQAMFNVVEEQLEAKRGLVRCGGCLKVFNAAWNLIDQPVAEQTVEPVSNVDVSEAKEALAAAVEQPAESQIEPEDSGDVFADDQLQLGFESSSTDEEHNVDDGVDLDEASGFIDEITEAFSESEDTSVIPDVSDTLLSEAPEAEQVAEASESVVSESISSPVSDHISLQATNDDYWEEDDEYDVSPILSTTESSRSNDMEAEAPASTRAAESEIVLPGEDEEFVEAASAPYEDDTEPDAVHEVDEIHRFESDFDEPPTQSADFSVNETPDDWPETSGIRKEPRLVSESGQYDLYDEELASNEQTELRRAERKTLSHEEVYAQEEFDEYEQPYYENREQVYSAQTYAPNIEQRHDAYYDEVEQTPAHRTHVLKDEEEEFDINKVDWVVMHGRSPAKIIAGVVALLLVLLIGFQARYVFLDELAQIDTLRPVLNQLCVATGCELPAKTDVQQIDLAKTKIESHPALPGALQISAELINRAEFPQPFPPLQLTLTDRLGHIVGRRSYPVEVYLADTKDAHVLMPGSSNMVTLDLANPNDEAVGFEVALLERL